jgi:hypothetical protein
MIFYARGDEPNLNDVLSTTRNFVLQKKEARPASSTDVAGVSVQRIVGRESTLPVMAGLVPAIHVLINARKT